MGRRWEGGEMNLEEIRKQVKAKLKANPRFTKKQLVAWINKVQEEYRGIDPRKLWRDGWY